MKINIFLNIKPGPYGGGNQFLKALRDYFIDIDVYSDNPELADIVLFNSHHQISELINLKRKYPQKIFIHRIDGPVFLIRKDNIYLDKLIYKFNDKIADASIFQSDWSRNKNIELGLKKNDFETTVLNAPNPEIFNKKDKVEFKENRKTKIIATSWASNMSKGFETYKYLDNNLDFSKFEMTFCGNSPYKFKNIKHIDPVPSKDLAQKLKENDIFITASQKDPCSNSLIEALHCGLPAIGLNDGGHPKIIKEGGLIYNKNEEIIYLLEEIKNNYTKFQKNINLPLMTEIGQEYFNFIKKVYNNKHLSKNIKKINLLNILNLRISNITYKIAKKFNK